MAVADQLASWSPYGKNKSIIRTLLFFALSIKNKLREIPQASGG